MYIAVIAHAHHPIKSPFAGGLEAHTHQLIEELIRQGHQVTLFAKAGSQTAARLSPVFRGNARDGEHPLYNVAYRHTMRRIAKGGYDLIINNSLNHTPLHMHDISMPPMITIFHTPPLPKMIAELHQQFVIPNLVYIAVSAFTAAQWQEHCADTVHVVANGMNMTDWTYTTSSPATPRAAWVGRITPEKGTHVAIQACIDMGLPLTLGGVIADKEYFNKQIKPLLSHDLITYIGHIDHHMVSRTYSEASVALVTPLWDEPFGLVVIEALAAGTPVAGLPNGALPTLVTDSVGAIADSVSAADLSKAITIALTKNRRDCIDYARTNFTLEAMVKGYLELIPEYDILEDSALNWQTAQ